MQTILVHLQANTSESERTIAIIEDTIKQPLQPTQLSQISLPKTTHEFAEYSWCAALKRIAFQQLYKSTNMTVLSGQLD